MYYKADWEEVKKRFTSFWKRENEGRCLLNVTASRNKNFIDYLSRSGRESLSLEEIWLDADKIIERHISYFENTYFAAEALPRLNIDLGPGATAAYLGSPVKLRKDTVWFEPIIEDWDKNEFSFDTDNFWWKKTLEITKKASESGKGRFLTGITDLSGTADILLNLRGSEKLCMDIYDNPEKVKEARDKILKVWFYCINELNKITQECQTGSINWMGIWAPELHHSLQCDFSAMLSPKAFEEFFLPEIQEQCRKLPYSIYHLDGPDAIRHIDMLLEIPELDAIQWVPGDGQPRAIEWIPLLKKIQSKGKGLVINAIPQDIDLLLTELSPKGLYVTINNLFSSSEEADEFVKKADSLCLRQKGQFS